MGALTVIKTIPQTMVKVCGKLVTKVKVNQPQLMVYGGAAVAVVGFGLAIYNATQIKDRMAVSEAKVDEIAEQKKLAEENGAKEDITRYEKELGKAKFQSMLEMAKLMGIPVILFTGGLMLIIGGHRVLVKRFGQLSTAFATLQEMYDRYRKMNIAEHGEECDRRYRYGIVGNEKVSETITDENGKERKVNYKLPVVDPEAAASMYTFCFSEDFSWKCQKDPINTISFLRSQETYWNTWMKGNHQPVTLYMVLNELGIHLDPDDPRNDYIMLAGWRPNGDGDNHIDFGIMRAVNKPAMDGLENVVYLNFNCDGNLFHSPRYTKNGERVC